MEAIEELSKIDFNYFVLTCFIIMSGFISIFAIIGKFSEMIGRPVKWLRQKKEDHDLLVKTAENLSILQSKELEDVKQSIRHEEMIKRDITKLSETVEGIAATLNDMKEKDNITEVKKLKEKLVGYYNKYKNSDGWTKVEKDVFWDLFEEYENRGGDGYIHSIVEPVMRELKEID